MCAAANRMPARRGRRERRTVARGRRHLGRQQHTEGECRSRPRDRVGKWGERVPIQQGAPHESASGPAIVATDPARDRRGIRKGVTSWRRGRAGCSCSCPAMRPGWQPCSDTRGMRVLRRRELLRPCSGVAASSWDLSQPAHTHTCGCTPVLGTHDAIASKRSRPARSRASSSSRECVPRRARARADRPPKACTASRTNGKRIRLGIGPSLPEQVTPGCHRSVISRHLVPPGSSLITSTAATIRLIGEGPGNSVITRPIPQRPARTARLTIR